MRPGIGWTTFFEVIGREKGIPPVSYQLTEEQRTAAMEMTKRLQDLGQQDGILQEGAPRPTPALRVRPTF